VRLAEEANGPIARLVAVDYVRGEALAEIDARSPPTLLAAAQAAGSPHRRQARLRPRVRAYLGVGPMASVLKTKRREAVKLKPRPATAPTATPSRGTKVPAGSKATIAQ